MFTEAEALEFVREARRQHVSEIVDELAALESRIGLVVDGPCEIPKPGAPMRDVWEQLVERCGRGLANFTVDGQRLFCASRRGSTVGGLGTGAATVGVRVDALDALLDRYDPGSSNVNVAAERFGHDLAAVIGLRARRGAILRDGVERAQTVAGSELEAIALSGPVAGAVSELVALLDETAVENADEGRSWADMSLEEQESVIGLVPDEPVDAGSLRGRWEQYSTLIADLEARRDAEVVAVLTQSSLRVVAKDLGISHTMVAKIAARGARRVLTVCG